MKKYFPKLFGNERTKNRIGLDISKGKMPHALIISGPQGSGKLTFAKEIAKALNCENINNGAFDSPCNCCNTCRRIEENIYPDVTYVEKEHDKVSFGVDPIRTFTRDVHLSSTEAQKRVFIFKNAELLTPQAQNALLKTLEEPPLDVVIILLVSSPDKILTTVKSRCQFISMERFSKEKVADFIKNLNGKYEQMASDDRDNFNECILSSDGRIGLALDYLKPKASSKNREMREFVMSCVESFVSGTPYTKICQVFDSLAYKQRNTVCEILEEIFLALRDIITVRQDRKVETLFFLSADDALSMGRKIGEIRAYKIYSILNDAHISLCANSKVDTTISNLEAEIKLL